jgi:RNA polymerase sigma-70 factor (ECF subfamily)
VIRPDEQFVIDAVLRRQSPRVLGIAGMTAERDLGILRGKKRCAGRHLQIAMSREMKPRSSPQDAARLIEAVAQCGDREAFTALFEQFAPRVKTYMLRSGTTNVQADELAQETLLMVWHKAALFEASEAGAAAWIFTIARNLRIDRLRRQGRETSALFNMDVPEESEQPDRALMSVERERRVRAALALLSAEQRQVVELSFFEEKPHPEIARELEIPLGTVKSRIRLAMKRLRDALDDLS